MKSLILHNIFVILIIALAIRILFAYSYDTADTGAFCLAGKKWLAQEKVYSDPQVYFSAPPFGLHLTGLTLRITNKFKLPCEGSWKLPAVFSDVGISLLIFLYFRKKSTNFDTPSKYAALYAYNPVAIFISGFHGQQESFWLFFILLAWYLAYFHKSLFISAASTAIAISYKIPAILLLPAVSIVKMKLSQMIFFGIIVAIIFSLSLFPEIISDQQALLRQSFQYSSILGVWGVTGIAVKINQIFNTELINIKFISTVLKLLLAVSLAIVYFLYWQSNFLEKNFFKITLLVILLFLVLTPGFGTQYLLWPLPFLVLLQSKYLAPYSVLVTILFLHTYNLAIPPINLVINWLQYSFYFKYKILYPYDLYYPLWAFLILILFKEIKYKTIKL